MAKPGDGPVAGKEVVAVDEAVARPPVRGPDGTTLTLEDIWGKGKQHKILDVGDTTSTRYVIPICERPYAE